MIFDRRRILITSGAGFVGSQNPDLLLTEAVDRPSRSTTSSADARGTTILKTGLAEGRVRWAGSGVRDHALFGQLLAQADPVLHPAMLQIMQRPAERARAFDLRATVQRTHDRLCPCAEIGLEDGLVDPVKRPGATRVHPRALADTRP
jgi:hypothetical protein